MYSRGTYGFHEHDHQNVYIYEVANIMLLNSVILQMNQISRKFNGLQVFLIFDCHGKSKDNNETHIDYDAIVPND